MKHKTAYLFCLGFIVVAVLTGFSASQSRKHREELALDAEKSVEVLFQDKKQTTPRLDLTIQKVEKAKKKVAKVHNEKTAKPLHNKLSLLTKYIKYRDTINAYFVEGVCPSDIDQAQMAKDEVLVRKLPTQYVLLLEPQLNNAKSQVKAMNDAVAAMKALYKDEAMSELSDNINRDMYRAAADQLNALPQKNLLEKYAPFLESADFYLLEQEEIARLKQEAVRKQNALIQASNVKLQGVPFYNQMNAGLPNGCECASLLMALHYKGYAKDMNLNQLADACPRSDNPHTGFVHSMNSFNPGNVVHWIAPDALSSFGSNYGTVVNISGCSSSDLKAEIDQGNPVVLYATLGFENAWRWDGEVPLNLHVMLLVGYNPISNSYIISDPILGELVISSQRFEAIFAYNRFAVSVR